MNAFPRKIIALIILATGILYSPTLHAADLTTYPAGSFHQNVVSIGKKQIPLPEGKWELKFSSALAGSQTGPLGNAERVAAWLLKRDEGRYSEALIIRTNNEQIDGSGWTRPPHICDRKNVHFNLSDKTYDRRDTDCWQVNHLVNTYTRSRNPTYQNLKYWARKNMKTTTVLALQFWLNDGYDILRVDYMVNPTHFGFPPLGEQEWKASQWHPEFIKGHAASERAITVLQHTGEKLHRLVQKGFQNELHGYISDFSLSLRR
ncbi:MAG: hypothetical protein ACI9JL_000892 [Paracoccaceae bacterium]|jgi:hypothetical protein